MPWHEALVTAHVNFPRLVHIMFDDNVWTLGRFPVQKIAEIVFGNPFRSRNVNMDDAPVFLIKRRDVTLLKTANDVVLSVDGDVEWFTSTQSPSPLTPICTDEMSVASLNVDLSGTLTPGRVVQNSGMASDVANHETDIPCPGRMDIGLAMKKYRQCLLSSRNLGKVK